MRQIKPQSGLLQSTPTQIGSDAFLGVAAGIGFRLGDPRILVHEASVWEALKRSPVSAPLPAPTLAKPKAEWLLMGHSVHHCPEAAVGRQVDWTCSVRVAGSTKTISCAAAALASPDGTTTARLATDHALAAAGTNGENPVGARIPVPPLQLVGALGISPSPTAGTGPIGTEWPIRQQCMPARPRHVEDMARDGTHMGWPAALDRRYFQLALPNQWSDKPGWPINADYELRGFGPRGQGFAGRLPGLVPRLFHKRRHSDAALEVLVELQTVWFLPDQEIGVVWWTGNVPGEYFDDDDVAELLLGFDDAKDPTPSDRLLAFAGRRKDLQDHDPELHGDTELMPSIEADWTWEVIVDSSDHPRFGLSPRTHAETCQRLATQLAMFTEAARRQDDAQARQRELGATEFASLDLPPAPTDGRDWRSVFSDPSFTGLDNDVIRDADLRGLGFSGQQFKSARFERCRLDATEWRECHFEEAAFVDCSFKSARMEATSWRGSSLQNCDLADAEWRGDRAENLLLYRCRLVNFVCAAGQWKQVSLIECRGDAGALLDMKLDALTLSDASLPDWHWRGVNADGIGLVKSHLDRLRVEACDLDKSSVVQSSLVASRWDHCSLRMGVFSAGSTIESSRFADCLFETSSWNELQAREVAVAHCRFASFTAQRLDAVGSTWRQVILDGVNAMHADFTGASFDLCSLKEAMLHGANLGKTRIHGCNLVGAKTGWALTAPRPAWSDNLEIGHLAIPRRHP